MKAIFCLAGLCLLAANMVLAQDAKRSRTFQSYQIDTLHLQGNPVNIKRNVIAIQKQEAVRSAFWDEKDHVLTVEYDSSMLDLNIIRTYFVANLSTRTVVIVARLKKSDTTD